jgi:hypothetical protein
MRARTGSVRAPSGRRVARLRKADGIPHEPAVFSCMAGGRGWCDRFRPRRLALETLLLVQTMNQ